MLIQTWGQVFTTSLQSLWGGFISFVPSLIVAIVIFIIGWIVGALLDRAITQVVGALKIDRLFSSAGVDDVMRKAGIRLSVGGFLGWLVKWFVIIVFLMTSLEIVGLTQVNDFLSEVVLSYLPRVIIAAFILILASVLADFMKKVIAASGKAANVHSANFLAIIAKYAIWIFAFIIALSELGIASQFMQILFTGIVAMLAIAGGLAFGLGGKDNAASFLSKLKNDSSSSM